ncbi:unnamed protein product [Caretta caretta]
MSGGPGRHRGRLSTPIPLALAEPLLRICKRVMTHGSVISVTGVIVQRICNRTPTIYTLCFGSGSMSELTDESETVNVLVVSHTGGLAISGMAPGTSVSTPRSVMHWASGSGALSTRALRTIAVPLWVCASPLTIATLNLRNVA